MENQIDNQAETPNQPRAITEIIKDLSKPIPDKYLKERVQGGARIKYIEWHTATRLLDLYAPGWSSEIKTESVMQVVSKNKTENILCLTVAITIPHAHGIATRQNTGTESISNFSGYGDPWSNAYSQALRRCAAMFGLARHLYWE